MNFERPSWSKGQTAGHIFGREPSNDYFIKILFLLSKWVSDKNIFMGISHTSVQDGCTAELSLT
jgi:hypothetical protein